MIIKNCLICSKEFKTLPSWIKRNGAKFCSLKCFGKSISKKVIKECPICSKRFKTRLHKGERANRGKFCSRKCYDISQRNQIKRNCLYCKKEFSADPFFVNRDQAKFCSKRCFYNWNREENHSNWKGDKIGYFGLHDWIANKLGRPTKCDFCGKDRLTGKKIHWANKNGEYKRDLSDWFRLCVSCHSKYDNQQKILKEQLLKIKP